MVRQRSGAGLWCCPVCQASLDPVSGCAGATEAPSARPGSRQDPCIWSCLRQPPASPEKHNNHLLLLRFFLHRAAEGCEDKLLGVLLCRATKACVKTVRVWRKHMHKYINKHTYGVSHTQWREKKVSAALPPPSQTFLEHLHSLNILAGVEKKAPLLSACHVCSLKETSLVLIRAPAKS